MPCPNTSSASGLPLWARALTALLLAAATTGCGESSESPAPEADLSGVADLAGSRDLERADLGQEREDEGLEAPDLELDAGGQPDLLVDAGWPDAQADVEAPEELGVEDGGADLEAADLTPDAGPGDQGPLEDLQPDLGTGDQGEGDGGAQDLGAADQGPLELGPEDQGPEDLGAPDLGGPVYEWQPEATCGMPDYEWLGPEEVGATTHWAEANGYRLPPELIEQLLAAAGYAGLVELHYGVRVFELRYMTQDQGQPVEASGMVSIPDMELPAGETVELPTMLVMHPTVGYADRCAPSLGLEGAAAALRPATQGYIGVAPDLIGLCGIGGEPCPELIHPYLIGEPTALAGLDAVRAAHESLADAAEETGILPDGRLLPWGPSQGGHGALFVGRYAAHYAPEFQLDCLVAVVPPADLAGEAVHALAGLSSATDLGTAFLAAASLWYDPAEGPASLFNANGPRDYSTYIPETFPTTCRSRDLIAGAETLEDIYEPEFLAAFQEGGWDAVAPWGCAVLENSLPSTSVPRQGEYETLMVVGEQDRIVSSDVEALAMARLCEQGEQIEFIRCAGENHTNAALHSIRQQLSWMAACLAGEPIAQERLCVDPEPIDCRAEAVQE